MDLKDSDRKMCTHSIMMTCESFELKSSNHLNSWDDLYSIFTTPYMYKCPGQEGMLMKEERLWTEQNQYLGI